MHQIFFGLSLTGIVSSILHSRNLVMWKISLEDFYYRARFVLIKPKTKDLWQIFHAIWVLWAVSFHNSNKILVIPSSPYLCNVIGKFDLEYDTFLRFWAGIEVYKVSVEDQSLKEIYHARHTTSWWKYSHESGLLLLGNSKDSWVQVVHHPLYFPGFKSLSWCSLQQRTWIHYVKFDHKFLWVCSDCAL